MSVARSWLVVLAAGLGCTSAPAAVSSSREASSPAPPGDPGVTRYLALGDSFTIGTGSAPERSFPSGLATSCGGKVELRNVAVNGYTTQNVIDRELPEISRFAPAYVTLAAGANDIVRGVSPGEYRAHLRVILGALVAAHVARVVALPQPDWSISPAAADFGEPGALHARIVEANGILREETTAAGGTYVDLFPLMEQQARARLLAGDGLHPSAEAYGDWAKEIARLGGGPCAR